LSSRKTIPPRLAHKILVSLLRADLEEEVAGDLQEKFETTANEKSIFRAKANYWYQVLHYMRPFAIRQAKTDIPNQYDMLQNYLIIGWRNLSKQKMYSAIKIGGFALGVAACFLIALFIRDEVSYDRHYTNTNRIFRVIRSGDYGEGLERSVWCEAPFARTAKAEFPEIERIGRLNASELFGAGSNEIRRPDQVENYYENGFAYADQELLNILEVPMVYGSREHALAEPNTIVLSKSKAHKYFPNEDPTGKLLILNNDESRPLKIGGVMQDFPSTSHLQFSFLITLTEREFWEGEQDLFWATNYPTYMLLREGTDPKALANKMRSMIEKYQVPAWKQRGMVDAKKIAAALQFELQPVSDIHLKSQGIYDIAPRGDIRYVWLFGGIAIFILIIAVINFVNLSTAKSANRAKEVGMRKVVGSLRGNLVRQFLTESLLFCLMAFVTGVLLTIVFLPYFNELAGKTIHFPWHEWRLVPIILVALFIVALLAGLYPSLYLSSFQPIQVLKGTLSKGSRGSAIRSLLVVFQFTTSIILVVCTIVIYRQMNFILNTKVGFDKEQVLLIHGTNSIGAQAQTFKDEILQLPEVESVSRADYLPIEGTKRNGNGFWKEGEVQTAPAVYGQFWLVDYDYTKTMGMRIVQGRDFNINIASDDQAVIINERLSQDLFQGDAIGKRITNSRDVKTIIGVVENFHFETMKEEIGPLCMSIGYTSNITSVKVKTADMEGFIRSVESVWKKFAPNQPIRYTFLDDSFAKMYDDVQRMGRIFSAFALLAIIVACLGLFALSAFMVEQRGKEISIRLVLGASVKSIFRLLTQDFVKMVMISCLIAAPLGWFLMKKWLEDFKYKTEITWEVFLISAGLGFAIALVTVSFQAFKAALISPATRLRSE
jgi:putative ABC transport system permease protein